MMAINPTIAPMTAPAIAPPDVFFFFFLFELEGDEPVPEPDEPADLLLAPSDFVVFEELLRLDEDDGDAHPTVALLGAHPSIKCAYACAPLVLGDHICCTLEPFASYTTAVSLCDIDISE